MAPQPMSSNRALPRVNRRDKPQLSCNFCKKRKGQPCDSCIRLGQAQACAYPFTKPPRANVSSSITMQDRINQLESLVTSLKQSLEDAKTDSSATSVTSSGGISSTSDEDRLVDHFGRIRLDKSEISYVEGNHWTAILDEIAELRDHVKETEVATASQEDGSEEGPDLFLAHTRLATRAEILAFLPSQAVVDDIVSKYFMSMDMPFGLILHRKVFLKQYKLFWERPEDTSLMWVAILLGILHMVAYFELVSGSAGQNSMDEQTTARYQQLIQGSREKMVQCFKMSNFLKGGPHTIEALLFYLQIEYVRSEDTQFAYWMILGTIIRIALKMGFHRDGSHFSHMSVFEAEMRRRIWSLLTQLDTLSSSQIGLPRMLKHAQSDTAEPRNLTDDDFDDTTTVLPPPKPPSEHTLTQFLVYKSRISAMFGIICDFTTSSRQTQYGEALRLDKILAETYTRKPPTLILKPIQESPSEDSDLIVRRMYLALTYRKAQITLHRKFMLAGKTEDRYAYSYATCITAALEVLHHQAETYEHSQPGRVLHGERWKILSLIQSDFLLATTILCFDLNHEVARRGTLNTDPTSRDTRQKIIAAMQKSYRIWEIHQTFSKEARKAVQALTLVLNQVQKSGILSDHGDGMISPPPPPPPLATSFPLEPASQPPSLPSSSDVASSNIGTVFATDVLAAPPPPPDPWTPFDPMPLDFGPLDFSPDNTEMRDLHPLTATNFENEGLFLSDDKLGNLFDFDGYWGSGAAGQSFDFSDAG